MRRGVFKNILKIIASYSITIFLLYFLLILSPFAGIIATIIPIDVMKIFTLLLIILVFSMMSKVFNTMANFAIDTRIIVIMRCLSIITTSIGLILFINEIPFNSLGLGFLRMFTYDVYLMIMGYTLTKLGRLILPLTVPIFNAVGYFLIFYGLSNFLMKIPFEPLVFLSSNLLYAGLALAGLSLLSILSLSSNEKLAELGRYIDSKKKFYTFLIFLLSFYVLSLRDFILHYLTSFSIYMPLIELLIGSFIISMIIDGIYSHFNRERIIYKYVIDKWKKHEPLIVSYSEPWLEGIENCVEKFVIEGDPMDLILRLTMILAKVDVPFDAVKRILSPLINYEKESIPIIAFRWKKRRIYRSQVEERVNIIKSVLGDIEKIVKAR